MVSDLKIPLNDNEIFVAEYRPAIRFLAELASSVDSNLRRGPYNHGMQSHATTVTRICDSLRTLAGIPLKHELEGMSFSGLRYHWNRSSLSSLDRLHLNALKPTLRDVDNNLQSDSHTYRIQYVDAAAALQQLTGRIESFGVLEDGREKRAGRVPSIARNLIPLGGLHLRFPESPALVADYTKRMDSLYGRK